MQYYECKINIFENRFGIWSGPATKRASLGGGRGRPGGQQQRYPPATTAADANFGEYSGGGGGGGHPIGACHVCPLHSPAKRRAISIKKRIAAAASSEHPTMTTTDGKKNGNFNFPPKNGPTESPGNELSSKSGGGGGDNDDDCGGKANGCSVASASVGEK